MLYLQAIKKKNEVIQWVDNCIEKYDVPYEFIELSLSSSKKIADILLILKSLYGKHEFQLPMYIMLGKLRSEFIDKNISTENFFTYIYSLYTQGCTSDEEMSQFSFLDRLSDGYYLATEGIYGEVEDIVQDALDELMNFEEYIVLLSDDSLN
ncbi:hypothetical protein HQN89_34745 [Paenibacillus frigoriresistens]|uniref:hypothetical protein n=1 Tax=Paenibacillus alginolyticus TaxID=59839 RepID=UPI001565383F|nr:hypothetical protein [Paenibacillus frigoriresistens]NRF95967.1 hypothetical protein [Paenibacillus frigoriresistens]